MASIVPAFARVPAADDDQRDRRPARFGNRDAEHGRIGRMSLRWFSVVVDCANPAALAAWWAQVLGFQVVHRTDREVDIAAGTGSFPGLAFLRAPDEKRGKNRLHLDLNPDDQAAEVARLLELGATRVDVGQDADAAWVVMADPEGNEFCVLARQDGW